VTLHLLYAKTKQTIFLKQKYRYIIIDKHQHMHFTLNNILV